MKCLLLLALTALALSACSHTNTRRAPSAPELSAAISRSRSISGSLSEAQQDSKEIKRAIANLQASDLLLHILNKRMLGNLDRADYKTKKLLQK